MIDMLLEKGLTVTSDAYKDKWAHAAHEYRNHDDKTEKSCGPLLFHENAHPHTKNQTKNCFSKLSFDVLHRPSDSPNMASNDVHLCRCLQHFLA